MKLEDCLTNRPPDTGECDIDIDIAIESFDEECSISQWQDEYRLIRTIPDEDGDPVWHLKVTIKKEDAMTLIDKLNLTAEASGIFNHASTWRQ